MNAVTHAPAATIRSDSPGKTAKATNNKRRARFSCALLGALLAVGLLGVANPAFACSDASLKGTYGITWGWPQVLYNGYQQFDIGQMTADGNGNVSGSYTSSSDGAISTGTFTGTYSILANCTGTVTLSGAFVNDLNIYLDDSNQGFQWITTDANREGVGVGVTQGTGTCGLTGTAQRFAVTVVGTIPGSQVNKAIGGQFVLDGKGHVAGTATFTSNFSSTAASLSGTYTEAADCTGTLEITPKGSSALNFSSVVVNGGKELLLVETDGGTVIGGTAQQ